MRNLALGLVILIGGALTLGPGCGDDSDDDATGGSSAGGSSGKGGSAGKGGSSDKGGSQSTGGDTGEAGTTSTGGDPGAGGSSGGAPPSEGGAGGMGGAGFMNPEGCPTEAPENMGDCFVSLAVQESCEYAGSRCVCNGFLGGGGAGGAMAGAWVCQGAGEDCPATAATNDECNDNGMYCPYPGGEECFCQGGDWNCSDPGMPGVGGAPGGMPGDCPEEAPEDAAECQGPIVSCFYDDSGTLCNCPALGPNADEWTCMTF